MYQTSALEVLGGTFRPQDWWLRSVPVSNTQACLRAMPARPTPQPSVPYHAKQHKKKPAPKQRRR